jgi:uncharacterized membrane protein required for colicin V production
MANQTQDFVANMPFGYFDAILLVWLLVGLLRGRKHGLTQELLPALQWTCIVLLAGFFNQPLGALLIQYTDGGLDALWSRIIAYGLIGFGTSLVFAMLKRWLDDRLTGSDVFGRYEYYLGMLAGTARFACMALALMAVMHSRIVTQAELDAIDAQMKKDKFDFHPPRYFYGRVEQAVFNQSFTGRMVQESVPDILIPTVAPPVRANAEHPKQKLQDAIDNPLGDKPPATNKNDLPPGMEQN